MKVFCITTFESYISFSLVDQDKVILDLLVGEKNQIKYLSKILSFFKSITKFEDLDSIFVTNGPGYYTTVRISCIIAQIISFILKKDLLFVDNFQAIINTYQYLFKQKEKIIPVIKIASKRYRTNYNNIDIETNNLEEIIKIGKKENIFVFSNLTNKEEELLKKYEINFINFSTFYRAGISYIANKNILKRADNYHIKIVY